MAVNRIMDTMGKNLFNETKLQIIGSIIGRFFDLCNVETPSF